MHFIVFHQNPPLFLHSQYNTYKISKSINFNTFIGNIFTKKKKYSMSTYQKFKYILTILILSFILFSPIFSLTSSACSLPRYDEAYSSLPHNISLVNINISYKIAKGNNILFFKENKHYFKYLSIISNNLSLLIGLSK